MPLHDPAGQKPTTPPSADHTRQFASATSPANSIRDPLALLNDVPTSTLPDTTLRIVNQHQVHSHSAEHDVLVALTSSLTAIALRQAALRP
jgi:hypothetical protein